MNEDNKIFKTNEFSIEISPVGKAIQAKDIQYFSYDENSGLQLIHILMDGKPLDLPNGTEIRLSAVKLNNKNQKLIYTPEIVDPLKGIVSFVIPREFLGYQGQIRCGLYINFSNNQTMHVEYFYINMGVSDIDTNLTEFTEDFWQGWSEFEAGSTAKMQELEQRIDEQTEIFNNADVYNKAEIEDKLEPFALRTDIAEVSAQLAQTEQKLSGFYNVKSFICDDGQYVKGDGSHDDTSGIQRALDIARGALFFPRGIYKITAPLILSRNLDIIGFSMRDAVIRADGFGVDGDILRVIITSNLGYTDVRNWRICNMTLMPNAGGRHALYIGGTEDGAMQMLSCTISNCNLDGYAPNSGKGLYITGNFAHGKITQNQIESARLAFYDANTIEKNLFSGNDWAITLDLINGVRNNVIRDNTIVNRDGAVNILNGSNVRIINNQMEQPSLSQNVFKTMVKIEGKDRICENIVISENNFGGGTNLDRLIYIDNAYKTVVEKNNLIAVNVAEIELTNNAKYSIIKFDNTVKSQEDNPRTDPQFKAKVIDSGVGTVGVLKDETVLNLQNGWTGGSFYKDESGVVHFYKGFSAGTSIVDTIIGTLPLGFRGRDFGNIVCITSAGVGYLKTDSAGVIRVGSLPSAAAVIPTSFVAKENE